MATINKTDMQIRVEEIVTRPTDHILHAGPENRNLLKIFVCSFNNNWIKSPPDAVKICADFGNALHDATIVLDDIQDGTILRRGLPSAHMVYGVPLTIRAALHKTFLIMQNLLRYVENRKYATVRVFCDDLDEGKFTFPMIHGILSHPNDHRLLDMLKPRPLDMESKKLFVDILESFGSFEYTRRELEKLKIGILTDADHMNMGKNPYLERILEDVLGNLETEIYYDSCD
ncbi:terpene synthase-like [Zophobas morio]|uniref:terpene synthase-like n=1 Tax=Zophobas morio TaxID=2755281 RepID=UPI0030834E97